MQKALAHGADPTELMTIDFQGRSNTVDRYLAEVKKDIAERLDLSDADVKKVLDDQ